MRTATCTHSNTQSKRLDILLAEPFVQNIVREIENPKNVTILIAGKVGVGKSSLVNALIGMDVAKTGDDVTSVTKAIDIITLTKKGININIIDTPGLGDMDVEDELTLQNANQEGRRIDLLLFCWKIRERFDRSALEQIKTIRDILGEDMWKRAVFVLTFANEYNKPEEGKGFNAKEFIAKLKEWEREFKKRMKKIINPEIAEKIPIVPTGHKEPHLPDRLSWISEFWIQGFRRMGFRAMIKLVLINQERIQSSMHNMKLSQNMYGNPEEQPLFTCHMSKEERSVVKSQEQYTAAGQAIGAILVGTATFFTPGGAPFVMFGMTGGAALGIATVNWFFNNKGKADNDCVEDMIFKSLIITFIEEYPEYDYIYEPLKNEL